MLLGLRFNNRPNYSLVGLWLYFKVLPQYSKYFIIMLILAFLQAFRNLISELLNDFISVIIVKLIFMCKFCTLAFIRSSKRLIYLF